MNEETQIKPNEAAKDLLLADHRYLGELFLRSEQLGETRVNWYIGIVTGAAGGLVALITKAGLPWTQVRPLVIGVIIALFAFGMVTLFRILKRNRTSDGFKKDLDHVRQIFRDRLDPGSVLVSYQPLPALERPLGWLGNLLNDKFGKTKPGEFLQELRKVRTLGGLAHTVATINSVLVGALAAALTYDRSLHALRISVAVFAVGGVAQWLYIAIDEVRGKRELKEGQVTKTETLSSENTECAPR